jgi:two-component system, NarL family, sensor histidine kinase DegS
MLDDLGVAPTLRRYIESFQEKNNISVSLTLTGLERRLEGHIEVTVFRAVQELLNNGRMHGQATQIQVQLDLDQELVTAVVDDNGRGFNVDDASSPSSVAGIGLSTLRERLEMLGGELKVQSRLGQGTRVEFRIPVSPEPAAV